MVVRESKIQELAFEFEKCGILEKDIEEKFIRGSGKGGQKQNKTASCVYLKHVPSGIEVKCQKERSREDNRFFARRQLLELYKEQVLNIKSKKTLQEEKIKKQKSRRKRRQEE